MVNIKLSYPLLRERYRANKVSLILQHNFVVFYGMTLTMRTGYRKRYNKAVRDYNNTPAT